MTKPVPIEAARQLRDHQEQADPDGAFVKVSRQAVDELVAFALEFEAQPLPGMSQEVVAGELREIRLVDDSLEAQSFVLIRLNGRVFAPEVVTVVETLHVAGNGNELTTETVDFVIAGLESDPECAAEDAVQLIKFLVEVVLAELREDEARVASSSEPGVIDMDPGLLGECAHDSWWRTTDGGRKCAYCGAELGREEPEQPVMPTGEE